MTIRKTLKDIYDMMMKSKELDELKLDTTLNDTEALIVETRYEAAEETLRQVFRKLHEEGVLDVNIALIREIKTDGK